MGHFQGNRGGGFRGNNSGGDRPFRGDREYREKEMHEATCSNCGKRCQVPFRPTGAKPVYCDDCFSLMRDDSDRAPRRDFGFDKPKRSFNDRPRHDDSRPAPRGDNPPAGGQQIAELSAKLDTLINAVNRLTTNVSGEVVKKPIPQKVELIPAEKPEVKIVPKKKAASTKEPVKTAKKKVAPKKK